jgi:hypothetical protein
MIRREQPGRWVLISQIDHAHLSAALAEHWGAGGVAPLVARDELLWAIYHHDDGWRDWDQSPDVEPKFARPRSFTEMELADSLEIWGQSIARAAEHGPLAGYVVAGHFCTLLRRFGDHWNSQQRQSADAARFLATNDALMEGCFEEWQARGREGRTRDQALLALAQLQMFDFLSLWFCCEEAAEPDVIETPRGPVVTLKPLKRSGDSEPIRVALDPWPFTLAGLQLEIPGRAIDSRRYQGRSDLAGSPSRNVLLRWELQAGSREI